MALQSQAPRASVNKRYTAPGRRRKGLAPWLALAGVAVVLAGLYFLFAGGSPGTAEPANAATPGGDAPEPGGDGAVATADIGQTPRQPNTPQRPIDRSAQQHQTNAQHPRRAQSTTPTPVRPTQAQVAALGGADDAAPLRGEAKDQFETGMRQIESGNKVAGRALLSELLFRDGALPRHEAQAVRELLAHENQRLVFSKDRIDNDTITTTHSVQSGEYLGPIANTYRTPYQFIERINGIDANRLQIGQKIKVLRGPVHARIDKSDYRMDLFVVDTEGLRIFLKSYTVGLGEFDSTPMGMWRVKPGSKVGPENDGPMWRNPRTGKVYAADDPDIPIGEYWMALEGTDENTRGKTGYGIHATNDPDSIGRQESMGCIRMADQDIDEVFYTLFEVASTVEIVP